MAGGAPATHRAGSRRDPSDTGTSGGVRGLVAGSRQARAAGLWAL